MGWGRWRRFLISLSVAVVGNAAYVVYVFLYNRFGDDSLIRGVLASRLAALQASDLPVAEIAARTARSARSFSPLSFSINVWVGLMLFALVSAVLLLAWPVRRAAPAR